MYDDVQKADSFTLKRDGNELVVTHSFDSSGDDTVFGGDGTGDQYRVIGTTANDKISIEFSNGFAEVIVVVNAVPTHVAHIGVEIVSIDGAEGDDSISVRLGRNAAAQFELFGGPGNDTIDASMSESTVVLRGGDGDDILLGSRGLTTVFGDAGTDRLIQSVRTGDERVVFLQDKLITDRAGQPSAQVEPTVGIEFLELNGTNAGEFIDATQFNGSVTLRGGGGNDRVCESCAIFAA